MGNHRSETVIIRISLSVTGVQGNLIVQPCQVTSQITRACGTGGKAKTQFER